jgi:hypothetical protein
MQTDGIKIVLLTAVATVVWAFMFVVVSEALSVALLIAVGIATLLLRRRRRLPQ